MNSILLNFLEKSYICWTDGVNQDHGLSFQDPSACLSMWYVDCVHLWFFANVFSRESILQVLLPDLAEGPARDWWCSHFGTAVRIFSVRFCYFHAW